MRLNPKGFFWATKAGDLYFGQLQSIFIMRPVREYATYPEQTHCLFPGRYQESALLVFGFKALSIGRNHLGVSEQLFRITRPRYIHSEGARIPSCLFATNMECKSANGLNFNQVSYLNVWHLRNCNTRGQTAGFSDKKDVQYHCPSRTGRRRRLVQ